MSLRGQIRTDMTSPSLNGTPIHNDSGTVVACSGHKTTWHVLVTSWDRDISIVMLGLEVQIVR